jgi:hypothetical protein
VKGQCHQSRLLARLEAAVVGVAQHSMIVAVVGVKNA